MTSTDKKPVRSPKPILSPDERRQRQRERGALLTQLVYETDAAGKSIYYAGYENVLNQGEEPESIMGASGPQSYLVDTLVAFLHLHPQARTCRFLYTEIGVQINRKKWRACDIAFYQRERLPVSELTNIYRPAARLCERN